MADLTPEELTTIETRLREEADGALGYIDTLRWNDTSWLVAALRVEREATKKLCALLPRLDSAIEDFIEFSWAKCSVMTQADVEERYALRDEMRSAFRAVLAGEPQEAGTA